VFNDLDTFFEKYSDSETMKLEGFKEFLAEHYNCFEGFNLSDDEIFIVFSSIDSHKKGNITLNDLKSKIDKYNFYDKMHSEIKSYLTSFFKNYNDAFTYFTNQVNEGRLIQLEEPKAILTVKELFDGINNLFIKKYTTNQVLNYIRLKFRNPEYIEYSEFAYIYYDAIITNSSFTKKTNHLSKSATNFRKRGNSLNSTPFDKDPFDKLRRILKSSKYDSREYFKIYQMLNDGKLNNNEFINMIKRLNLGFTLLEINHILARLQKTKDGSVNIKDFLKFLDFE
jgi:Ca2+-binding EF-hand superfamily protein